MNIINETIYHSIGTNIHNKNTDANVMVEDQLKRSTPSKQCGKCSLSNTEWFLLIYSIDALLTGLSDARHIATSCRRCPSKVNNTSHTNHRSRNFAAYLQEHFTYLRERLGWELADIHLSQFSLIMIKQPISDILI